MVRLLEYDQRLVPDGGTEVCCKVGGPIAIGYKEPVGAAFHLAKLKQAGVYVYPVVEDTSAKVNGEADSPASKAADAAKDADDVPPSGNWKGGKKKKKSRKEGEDMYALLNLQNDRWTANEQQIKAAYRKVCLEAHPDKALVNVTDEDERERVVEKFKKIQEAYETLSDPAKRREYDSTDDFDDSLPSDCAPGDFFKVFAPAFRRNARWSTETPPDVGDANTPYEAVSKFYDFWYRFKSWREFPHPDEEDVEGAESREHRRWIERFNSKLREKGKKDEGRRLRDFVEAAYKYDPRIIAQREKEKQEKERKKFEKESAKRQAIEAEEKRKADEEAAKKAAEDEEKARKDEDKKIKKAAKIILGQQRQRLRAHCAAAEPKGGRLMDPYDAEKVTLSLDLEQLTALNDSMDGQDHATQKQLLTQAYADMEQRERDEAAVKEEQKQLTAAALQDMAKRDNAKKLEAMKEWSEEELRMLDKATNKFVQGTPKRWEQVTAYVRTRTLEEVLLMVKTKQGASNTRMKAQEDWKAAQKTKADLRGATLDTRAYAFTDVNVNLRGEAAKLVEPGIAGTSAAAAATPEPAPAAAAAPVAATAATAGTPAPAANGETNGTLSSSSSASDLSTTSRASSASAGVKAFAAASAIAAAAKKVVSVDSGEWNEEQELALVKALKQFGKDCPERWERVSEVVPGKNKTQCMKRFKELREAFKSKKTTGGEGADEE